MARKATRENVAAQAEEDARARMMPQQRFDAHYPKIRKAKLALEKAQTAASAASAEYRNLLKAYKSAGGDTDALLAAYKFQQMDTAEADVLLAGINWHLRALGSPVGTQLGLFPDGKTVAHHVDNDKLNGANGHANGHAKPLSTKKSIAAAKAEGKKAGSTGKAGVSTYPEGSPEDLAFVAAWKTAQAAAVHSGPLGREKGNGSKTRADA